MAQLQAGERGRMARWPPPGIRLLCDAEQLSLAADTRADLETEQMAVLSQMRKSIPPACFGAGGDPALLLLHDEQPTVASQLSSRHLPRPPSLHRDLPVGVLPAVKKQGQRATLYCLI